MNKVCISWKFMQPVTLHQSRLYTIRRRMEPVHLGNRISKKQPRGHQAPHNNRKPERQGALFLAALLFWKPRERSMPGIFPGGKIRTGVRVEFLVGQHRVSRPLCGSRAVCGRDGRDHRDFAVKPMARLAKNLRKRHTWDGIEAGDAIKTGSDCGGTELSGQNAARKKAFLHRAILSS